MSPGRSLVLLCLVVTAARARAMDVLEVRAGLVPGESGAYQLDARVLLEARPMAVRHVLTQMCTFKDRMDNLAYCRIFKVEGTRAWSYNVVELPVLDPRDYLLMSTVEEELSPDGSGTYRTRWESAKPPGAPGPRKGFVRITRNEGAWTLTPVQDGQRTLVRYQIRRLTPGGIVPAWAASYVARRTLPDHMRLLETLALEEEARGRVEAPVPGAPFAGAPVAPLDNPLPPVPRRAPRPPLPPDL